MNPRFSILIPTYNREQLVGQTVDSILSQTFPGFEIIVVDDGSTDRTPAVLESYGGRIKVLRQTNQGPEAARRLGASVATGEYFVLLDSDDLLLPWALATYDQIVRECNEPALIIGVLSYFDDGQDPWPKGASPDELRVLRFRDYFSKTVPVGLSSSNIVVRKSVFAESGASRNMFATFPMDTFHYVLLFGTFGPCAIMQTPNTVAYRIHATNTVRNVSGMVKGLEFLLDAERQGLYAGGRSRRFDRYVCIGGVSLNWIKKALKHGLPGLAARTLVKTSPMILAGALRKTTRIFHLLMNLVLLCSLVGRGGWTTVPFMMAPTDGFTVDGLISILSESASILA